VKERKPLPCNRPNATPKGLLLAWVPVMHQQAAQLATSTIFLTGANFFMKKRLHFYEGASFICFFTSKYFDSSDSISFPFGLLSALPVELFVNALFL
jgi:hypothetical protein